MRSLRRNPRAAACGRRVLLALVVTLVATGSVQSDDPAADALAVSIDLESKLLDDDLEGYSRAILRRKSTDERLVELRRAVEAAIAVETEISADQFELILFEVERVEGERAALVAAERVIVRRIRERRIRISYLREKVANLRDREPEIVGELTGTWDLTMMPLRQRGTFLLTQSGTLISGTYRLDGGWTGSLEGTLVNNKVLLDRIDSKLGRMMEFEGRLSSDGTQIRGSWLNRELAGNEGSTGQWLARKRQSGP
ncbi:MAG: hypothetical protein GY716_06455 [bacterium]|nr:hypothetical protein [bacterium]